MLLRLWLRAIRSNGIIRSDWLHLKDGQWTGSFGWGDVEWASLNELEQDNETIRALIAQIPNELDIWIKCDGRKLCVYSWWLLMNNSDLFGYLIIKWIEKSWTGLVNESYGRMEYCRQRNQMLSLLLVKWSQSSFPSLWRKFIKTWMIWSRLLTRAA